MRKSWLKKLRTFGVGLLIVGALVSPLATAKAEEPLPGTPGAADYVAPGTADAAVPTETQSKSRVQAASDAIKGATLVAQLSSLIDYVAGISPFSSKLFSCDGSQQCVQTAVQNANRFILNLVNLFYILVLLLIAIAQIFGVENYSIQRMLPKLILAILLSTFGLFFVRLATDTAQLLTIGLIPSGGVAQPLLAATSAAEILSKGISEVAGLLVPGVGWFYSALQVFLNPLNWFALAFLVVAIILFLRIAALWVLAVLAPFGVAFGVLPSTQGFAKVYWRKVLSYAFIGPILIFFLRLAVIVYTAVQGKLDTGFLGTAGNFLGGLLPTTPSKFLGGLMAFMVLALGIAVVRKLGVEVANFTIGAFKKAFKTALGLGKTAVVATGAAIGTAVTGGGTLAGFLAARGVTEATQKTIGLLGSSLGTGLKSSGIKPLQNFGALIQKPSQAAYEKQVAPNYKPDARGNTAARQLYRKKDLTEGDTLRALAKENIDLFNDQYINNKDLTDTERLTNAMFAAEAGKIGAKNIPGEQLGIKEATAGLKEENNRQILTREVRKYSMLVDPVIGNDANPNQVSAIRKFVAANADQLHLQNDEVFGNDKIVGEIERVLSPQQWQRFVDRLNPKKQRIVGQTLREVAADRGTQGRVQEFVRLNARADRLGSDPLDAYNPAFYRGIRDSKGNAVSAETERALRQAADALKQAAIKTPEVYKNQTTEIAGRMIVELKNAEKVGDVLKGVSKAVRQEFKRLARDPSVSFQNNDVRLAILGSMMPEPAPKT
ncbi:MAG: hypothetical protein U0517_03815 [Candidatus Andersenbacteria bacterium]